LSTTRGRPRDEAKQGHLEYLKKDTGVDFGRGTKCRISLADAEKITARLLELRKALRHAYDRLNSLPHRYGDTDFRMLREALELGGKP
jgi:hypothetical protein